MTATLDEVLARWTNVEPGMKWVLFRPSVCGGTELEDVLESIRDEGAPGVTDASVEHFGQVISAPANVCAVEVIRHALYDYRCILIEKDLLAGERAAISRAGEVVVPGISLDYLVQNGPASIYSVLKTNHNRFQMLMTLEMKRYESDRYAHHLAALENTEDPARLLLEERLRISPGLNDLLPEEDPQSVVRRVVDGVALVRALTDHVGVTALESRDVAMGVRLFETADQVSPAATAALAQWRTGVLEEKRDRLQNLSLETMRWFYDDIEPVLSYVLNHPDWD